MKRKLIGFIIIVIICLTGLLWNTFASSKVVEWYSFNEGIARGKSEGKIIYINFYAVWCGPCKYMEKTTFSNPAVILYLNKHFISIKVDIDKETEIASMFRVKGVPDNWFIFKNGDKIEFRDRQTGYIKPDPFMKKLKSLREGISEKKKD
jgi:thiol:disulfide interchange protein